MNFEFVLPKWRYHHAGPNGPTEGADRMGARGEHPSVAATGLARVKRSAIGATREFQFPNALICVAASIGAE